MSMNDISLLPSHFYPHLWEEAISLLNSEWPRSVTARRIALERSRDTFPTSLLLVRANHVIGYAQVAVVQGNQDDVVVESVIISSNQRGQGLGRILMHMIEDYVKRHHKKTIHLSTHDKLGFYTALAYTIGTMVDPMRGPRPLLCK
eukprot:Ihof_evm2s569 gene=Ihof_evmTU2s569